MLFKWIRILVQRWRGVSSSSGGVISRKRSTWSGENELLGFETKTRQLSYKWFCFSGRVVSSSITDKVGRIERVGGWGGTRKTKECPNNMRRGQWTPLNPAPRVKVDCVRCSCLLSLYVLSALLLYDYLYLLCVRHCRWLVLFSFFFRLQTTLFYFIIKIYLLGCCWWNEEPLAANGSRDGWPMLHKMKRRRK